MRNKKTKGLTRTKVRTGRTILAGGGVVWRTSGRGSKIVLVSRVKYGDWALPKGKLKRGETFEEGARREVREETGCTVRLAEFVGLMQYTVKSEPKVVLYWNMECTRSKPHRPNKEIAKVVWLRPSTALRRMSYAGDRRILRAAIKLRR